jgi:hypothetical protein
LLVEITFHVPFPIGETFYQSDTMQFRSLFVREKRANESPVLKTCDALAKQEYLRFTKLEATVLVALVAFVSYQLFCEPIVGVANNADFARIIGPGGLGYKSPADYWGTVFKFIETKYVATSPIVFRYLTSQRPLFQMALGLNSVVSKDGLFDLRVMGLCNLAAYVCAVAVFLRSFRFSAWSQCFVAGVILLICPDVKWVAYFNSFYSESASLIFLFLVVGAALLCIQSTERFAWPSYLFFLFAATLFWTAKSQNTAFTPCLALGAWSFFPDRKRLRLRLLATIVLPACVGLAFATHSYVDTTQTNVTVVLNDEIIPHSKNPEADKRELLAGKASPTFGTITGFYLRHRGRWWNMANRSFQEAFGYIPYGNFDRSAGLAPGAESQAFNFWSEFKKKNYPKDMRIWIGILVMLLCFGVAKAKWVDKGRAERVRTLMSPCLALGCLLEFVVTVTFEANGTAKHLFIFNVAVDLCFLLALSSLLELAGRRWLRAAADADTNRLLAPPP